MSESEARSPQSASLSTVPEDLKASIANMFLGLKDELMQHVEDCVAMATQDHVVHDADQDEEGVDSAGLQLLTGIDNLTSGTDDLNTAPHHAPTSSQLEELVHEFSTSDKTSPAVDDELAKLIDGLITNKLPKPKLDELLGKYHRPENCTSLLAPKTNKAIWGQLKDSTRKTDIGMQKCQTLYLAAAYALLQASQTTSGETKTTLIHALVLILSGNREFNLKRRELLKPDLNSQFSALCSASTPITTQLFGDDVSIEIDEVAKSNKLSKRLSIPKKGRGARYQPYTSQGRSMGVFNQSRYRYGGRGFTHQPSFLGDKSAFRRKSNLKQVSNTKTSLS